MNESKEILEEIIKRSCLILKSATATIVVAQKNFDQAKDNAIESQKVLDEAKAKLEALPKPIQIRTGDYGYGYKSRIGWLAVSGTRVFLDNGEIEDWEGGLSEAVRFGNTFDDLERNNEDLSDFDIIPKNESDSLLTIGRTFNPVDWVHLNISVNGTCKYESIHLNPEEAVLVHQKLGQIIATARRKSSLKSK